MKKLSTGCAEVPANGQEKKSPFKNTLKKRTNGILKGISKLIACGRRRERRLARAYGLRPGAADAAMLAADEATRLFNGTAVDHRLWEGAAYALGVDDFLELIHQQRSENLADGPPDKLPRAFQAKLNAALRKKIEIPLPKTIRSFE